MKRSGSSKRWLREHVDDAYVQLAQREGYRSRAAYKLMAIDDADHLLRPGSVVVDLGSSPGGWSQVAAERLHGRGRVIAIDLLPMTPLRGVTFVQGDFREAPIVRCLEAELAGSQVDLVLSDLAPNLSGIPICDQARSLHLAELALAFACRWLKPEGAFLVKVFQGQGFDHYLHVVRQSFRTVGSRKPDASRSRSAERYLLGKTLKCGPSGASDACVEAPESD